MRVLLVSTNREMLPDPVFPLGLAYVAGALEAAGHEVEVVDLCFVRGAEAEVEGALRSAIEAFAPEAVGLAIRNIDDVSYPKSTSYLGLYRQVIAACRAATAAPLIVGGSGFTIMPGEFLDAFDVDYGVVGEGERAMVELLDHLAGRGGGALPMGVMTRASGPASPARLERWSDTTPARRLFSATDYYEKGGMLSLQTRRGCPFGCVYCSYPRIEGSRPRLRPVAEAVDELERLATDAGQGAGVRHVFIVDSVFNHPRDYALAFCDEVIRRGLDVKWTCYANPGHMDGALIERMRRAGCEGVEFGTDGLVDEVLDALGKGFSAADVAETSRLCRELGLRFCHFVFLGAPDEDLDRAELMLDRLARLEADSTMIMAGIRLFPGTPLAERARAELGIDRVGLEPVFYLSPAIFGALDRLVERIVAEHPSWVLPGFRRNFDERIQRILRRSGKRGVLWDFLSPR
jgi:radical SAM superfamily enzyme YgiQ (UPF0313 family)